MKEKIKKVEFVKEYPNKFKPSETLYLFRVFYAEKNALYSSKSKEQNKFVAGQEAEFTEVTKENNGKEFIVIKPIYQSKFSGYARKKQQEVARYSGFSESYVKDLLTAGILKPEFTEEDEANNEIVMITWKKYASEVCEHMVELDKKLEQ